MQVRFIDTHNPSSCLLLRAGWCFHRKQTDDEPCHCSMKAIITKLRRNCLAKCYLFSHEKIQTLCLMSVSTKSLQKSSLGDVHLCGFGLSRALWHSLREGEETEGTNNSLFIDIITTEVVLMILIISIITDSLKSIKRPISRWHIGPFFFLNGLECS